MKATKLCLFLLATAVFSAFPARALTVEKFHRSSATACDVTLSYSAADSDRAVLVAWGASDAGASFTSWANRSYAEGVASAGSTSCRVALPPAALSAAYMRLFLVPDNQQLDYIETDGTQYIQTDYYPGPADTAITVDFQPKSVSPYQQRVFGTATGFGLTVHAYINSGGQWSWSYSNAGNWTSSGINVELKRTQILLDGYTDKYTLTIDGVQKKTMTISGSVTAANRTGTSTTPLNIAASAPNVDQRLNAKYYSFAISHNGTLARDFRPYVKHGVVGMRDAVTGKFFPRTAGNMLLGAPPSGTVASETSAAVAAAPVAVTSCYRSDADVGTLDVSFAPSSSAREVWYAWDEADKGATFSAWARNERIGTLAANATYGRYHLPPGAKGFSKGRIFVLPSGGSYDCAYIRGDGRHCIDTGILAGTNVCISADLRLLALDVQQRAFGVDTSLFTLAAYINGSGFWAWAAMDDSGNWTGTTLKPSLDHRTQVTLDCPNDRYVISHDGQQVLSVALSSDTRVATNCTKIGNVTLGILASKAKNGLFANFAYAELYGASVQTNGIAARAYSPCVVNGEARMRDAVTGATFGNGVTNYVSQFIPGGRLDAPSALAVGDALDLDALAAASAQEDVMADAAFWIHDFSGDLNGNGLVDDALSEGRDFLGRTDIKVKVYSHADYKPVFTNELVRMPGRNAARQMDTLYFPQPIEYTNEAQTAGRAYPSTYQVQNALTGFDDHYTLILRVRPDWTTPCYSTQWLVQFAHGAGKGLMFGFTGTGAAKSRKLTGYVGGTGVDFGNILCTNGWCDIAMIANGRKLTCMLMRDWRQTGETTGATQVKTITIPVQRELTPNGANFLLGAESTTTGARPYPMGANDNSLKCFRGSIAQVAAWRRSLSTEEVYRALGWPNTDRWRVGVQDGQAGPDFEGTRPADGFDVDGTAWPLKDGLAARQSVTFKFPLENLYETALPQFLRWKSVEGSAKGRLQLVVNGRTLETRNALPGKWSYFYVPTNALRAATNTLTVTRLDSGAGAIVPDTVAFGGGWQLGKLDGGYSEYGQEWSTGRDYYAASGNLRDLSRVLQTGRSPSVTNLNVHFYMPAELASACRWRIHGAITGGVYPPTSLVPGGKLPMRVDFNGRNVIVQSVTRGDKFAFEVEPEDMPAGLNHIVFMNASPNLGDNKAYYFGFDAIVLEPIRPTDATFLFVR